MKVLITGAGGFVGSALVDRLQSAAAPLGPINQLILIDQRLDAIPTDPRQLRLEGDFGDPRILSEALRTPVDAVFHLASVPGGLAERQFDVGLRVNLQSMIALLEAVRAQGNSPRFVFASTIGVYGVPLPALVDEQTLGEPTMSYGAQKLIGEVLVADYNRRDFIRGCSLRLPGIVARPPQPSGMLSAFLSDSIRTLAAGGTFTFPVSAKGKSWWMSRACLIENLLHAARLDLDTLKSQRVWMLPVLHASMEELVVALAKVHGPHVIDNARYAPNAALEAQFASYPPMECPRSLAAGFMHDGTLEAMVRRALQ